VDKFHGFGLFCRCVGTNDSSDRGRKPPTALAVLFDFYALELFIFTRASDAENSSAIAEKIEGQHVPDFVKLLKLSYDETTHT
jgi:hypothetical protein